MTNLSEIAQDDSSVDNSVNSPVDNSVNSSVDSPVNSPVNSSVTDVVHVAVPRSKRLMRILKRRPVFRTLTDQDLPVMCVAYDRGAFDLPKGLLPESLAVVLRTWTNGNGLLVIEDESASFKAGRGPVGLVKTNYDGWQTTPQVIKFSWATKYNAVRAVTAYLADMKKSRDIGVCVVMCGKASLKLMERMAELKLLFRCGHVPNGFSDGPMDIFNISGRKKLKV